jgi:hypothetical protein
VSAHLLLHQDGRWLSFDDERVALHDSRPRLDRSTIVVTDFDGAVSDITSLEGSPSHAVALIERRLRADGLIDGDSKVLIHQLRTVGNGYQALYTAVPLDRWQQMFAWADNQADHCLLVPTVALLWKRLRPGHGVVLHSGRKVVFLAALRNRVEYASALAFSESREDLAMTVAALGERAGMQLPADDGALEALDIEWIAALTPLPMPSATGRVATARVDTRRTDPTLGRAPTPEDTPTERTGQADADPSMTFEGQHEYAPSAAIPASTPEPVAVTGRHARAIANAGDAPLDEVLLEIFATSSGASVTLAPHVTVTDAQGQRYRSGALPLLRSASAGVSVNSGAARAMFLSERLLPWASAASLLLALGLGALGGRWTLAAHGERSRAEALRAEIEAIDAQTAGIEQSQQIPTEFPAVAGFISRATGLAGALDPAATLRVIREAAGADVRILRMRLDTAVPDQPTLRIDGLVNYGGGVRDRDRGQQVARFVQRLRDAGYVPVAIDPQAGNAGAGAPGGLFSYQLTRAPSSAATGVTP